MTYATMASQDFASFERRSWKVSPGAMLAAVALAFSLPVGAWMAFGPSAFAPRAERPSAPAGRPRPVAMIYSGLLAPDFARGKPVLMADSAPLASVFLSSVPRVDPSADAPHDVAPTPVVANTAIPLPVPAGTEGAQEIPLLPPAPVIPQIVQDVPLPTPRPAANREWASQGPPRAPARQMAQRGRTTVPSVSPPDNRGFFEKLFGMSPPSGPVLGYAAPEDGAMRNMRSITRQAALPPDGSTAVYDISAHMLTLPNGSRLEAHSGLGELLDDPRHVDQRMRGATPPQVYDLTLREQLFHGVQALRLNPVGGGGVYGRTGLLAHTYMLGPNGDSNGCVSIKDYNTFLRAYMNGEVRRLIVVARQT